MELVIYNVAFRLQPNLIIKSFLFKSNFFRADCRHCVHNFVSKMDPALYRLTHIIEFDAILLIHAFKYGLDGVNGALWSGTLGLTSRVSDPKTDRRIKSCSDCDVSVQMKLSL